MPWDNPGPNRAGFRSHVSDSGSDSDLDFENMDTNDPAHLAKFAPPGAPIPETLPPDDLRQQAREKSRIIHETYRELQSVVVRHEETIQKRWAKKSKQQRHKVLLECWPGMAASHRPDFEAFRKESEHQRYKEIRYRVLLSEPRALRTPEWVDEDLPTAPAAGKKQHEKNVANNDGAESLLEPLSTLYFDSEKATVNEHAKVPTALAKVKTKPKGEAKEASGPAATPGATSQTPESRPEIQVDARALKVFRALFFNPVATSTPGEVSWHDFVYAMTSTGLFSAKKLYGSAWQFERLDAESQTRIQFHQPHPRGKIPFTNVRRMGRRLTRAFGWVGEMFVPKEAAKAKK